MIVRRQQHSDRQASRCSFPPCGKDGAHRTSERLYLCHDHVAFLSFFRWLLDQQVLLDDEFEVVIDRLLERCGQSSQE
jgi:hypothetical protein